MDIKNRVKKCLYLVIDKIVKSKEILEIKVCTFYVVLFYFVQPLKWFFTKLSAGHGQSFAITYMAKRIFQYKLFYIVLYTIIYFFKFLLYIKRVFF